MALHGGVLPVGGTFFVFSDYARPAVRLAAISQAHVIYFFTHDSDRPRRGRPDAPADRAARLAAGHAGPAPDPPGRRQRVRRRLACRRRLGRPDGPRAEPPGPPGARRHRRARASRASPAAPTCSWRAATAQPPDIVLIGTGSEVQHCVAAAELLAADGIVARVVSFPSWDLFEPQDAGLPRRACCPPGVPRLAVEAAASFGWERYADATVTIDRFGASAPGSVNMEKFGFTADNVADAGPRAARGARRRAAGGHR